MKLSIIVPCYNVAAYIQQCFQSIEQQLQDGYEAIFINDGATDATGSILDELHKQSVHADKISILHQQNKGLSGARNAGIDVAQGEMLTFIDGDDWIAHNYFTTLIEGMAAHDLAVVSYNRVFAHRQEPRFLGWNGVYKEHIWKRRLLGLVGEELHDPSQADAMVTAWGKLYKTSIIKSQKLYFVDTKIIGTEDLLFNLEYAQFIKDVVVMDLPLYQYRKDNNVSLTKTYKADLATKWQKKYEYIQQRITINSADEQTAFQNRIALSLIGLGLNEMGNQAGSRAIIANLRSLLQKPHYQSALAQLPLVYFPIHWKLFFGAARAKQAWLLYALLKVISTILDRKNQ